MNHNHQIINDFFAFFRQRSPLPVIILINIAVFIFVNLVKTGIYLANLSNTSAFLKFISLLAVPANINSLLEKPWTIITYMFLHEGFFHILFNMLILFFAGKLFLQYIGRKRIINVYIFGGICGAAFFILSYNIFPVFESSLNIAVALGASASVLAVLTAIATFIPNYSITLFLLGRIKLKYIVAILLLIDLMSIEKNNPGGHIAHLGGALYGFVFIYFGNKNYLKLKVFKKIKGFFSFKPKLRKVHSSKYNDVRYMSDDKYNAEKVKEQNKIDKILDKISRSGYQSLTKEEKDFLFSKSRNK